MGEKRDARGEMQEVGMGGWFFMVYMQLKSGTINKLRSIFQY